VDTSPLKREREGGEKTRGIVARRDLGESSPPSPGSRKEHTGVTSCISCPAKEIPSNSILMRKEGGGPICRGGGGCTLPTASAREKLQLNFVFNENIKF